MVYVSFTWILNFANSIVGVGLLAMPYCFQQCGIVLATLMVSISAYLTKITCDFLLRAGSYTRKSTYEQVSLYIYGPTGKLMCEISTIGVILGTLVAFQVVIGDLAPAVAQNWLGFEKTSFLRAALMVVACGLVLPISLMRNVSSLASLNVFSMTFYACFVAVVVFLSLPIIYVMDWWSEIHFWRLEGFFKCLPIILLSFNCQAQVFIFYAALPDPNMKTMMAVVNQAINLVNFFYVTVGIFGYIAFYKAGLLGDVLENFPESFLTDIMKLGFLLSVVISFPLMIFPVRSSFNSLLFTNKRQGILHDVISSSSDYIAPDKFVIITLCLIFGTLVVGILVPKIEIVLSITGSLAGSFISFVYPSALFLKAGAKDKMRNFGMAVLLISSFVMIACTSSSLSGIAAGEPAPVKVENIDKIVRKSDDSIHSLKDLIHTTMGAKVDISDVHKDGNIISKLDSPTKAINFAGLSNTIKFIEEKNAEIRSVTNGKISDIKFDKGLEEKIASKLPNIKSDESKMEGSKSLSSKDDTKADINDASAIKFNEKIEKVNRIDRKSVHNLKEINFAEKPSDIEKMERREKNIPIEKDENVLVVTGKPVKLEIKSPDADAVVGNKTEESLDAIKIAENLNQSIGSDKNSSLIKLDGEKKVKNGRVMLSRQ